jgi:hypothetical protein
MTIIAHLVLWACLTFVFALIAPKECYQYGHAMMFAAAGFLAALVLAVPISLVCVVRFWWGN